jgi:hypothetical protein
VVDDQTGRIGSLTPLTLGISKLPWPPGCLTSTCG